MTQPLTEKYRPSSFEDMVGQRINSVVLNQMVETDSVPRALLFAGPRGTGKTSAARILGMELNPEERGAIFNETSLAVLEIDSASHGSVADIRDLVEQVRYRVGAQTRVIILDEAHAITRDGFNALLKTLEEPPEGVIFVLVTTEPHKLPPTILSRVMEFEFSRVAPVDLFERLVSINAAEGLGVTEALLLKIAEVADGSARDAVKNLDFVARAGITTVDDFTELIGYRDVAPFLFAALLKNDHALIFSTLDKIMLEVGDARVVSDSLNHLFTDLFVLKSGGEVTASGQALEYRVKLAKATDSANLYAAVQILWDLKTRVRQTEDQRAALNMALVLVAEKLSGGKTPVSVTPDTPVSSPVVSEEPEVRSLSIEEMQQS